MNESTILFADVLKLSLEILIWVAMQMTLTGEGDSWGLKIAPEQVSQLAASPSSSIGVSD